MEYSDNMTTPLFIAKFKDGPYFENSDNFYQLLDIVKRTSSDCEFHELAGSHHSHLNNPENLSELINNFLSRHYKNERSAEGIAIDTVGYQKNS